MKRISVYLRNGGLFVHPQAHTRNGLWILEKPVFTLVAGATESEKESLCLRALSLSRRDVRDPEPSENISTPLLEVAGVRSWRTFMKGVKLCEVEETGSEFVFLPYKTVGSGFEPINDRQVRISAVNGEQGRFAAELDMCLSIAH